MRAILLVLLLTTVVCSLKVDTSNAAWQRFKEKFNKQYATPHEESMRRNIWANKLLEIAELNAKLNTNGFGETPACDLTDEEFRGMYLMSPEEIATLPKLDELTVDNLGMVVPVFTDPPESYDLRTQQLVTPVRDQKSCGSCWAFAATAVAETAYIKNKLGTPSTTDLSEQYVLECTKAVGGIANSCFGGWSAYGLLQGLYGFARESSCPYRYSDNDECTCAIDVPNKFYDLVYQTYESDGMFTDILADNNAIAVAVDATGWDVWTGSDLPSDACTRHFPCGQVGSTSATINHAVTLVGYTSDHWIIKNSWSEAYGCKGYYFLARSPNNQCFINQYHSYFVLLNTTTTA